MMRRSESPSKPSENEHQILFTLRYDIFEQWLYTYKPKAEIYSHNSIKTTHLLQISNMTAGFFFLDFCKYVLQPKIGTTSSDTTRCPQRALIRLGFELV